MRTVDAGVLGEPALVWNGTKLVASWSESGFQRGISIDVTADGAVVRVGQSAASLIGES
jgi:hypothetical protein